MAMRIIDLQSSHIDLGDTRKKLGADLTLDIRRKMAAEYKISTSTPYQTKYWPENMVLEVCQRFGVEPVLTEAGRRRVREVGGLVGGRQGVKAPPVKPEPTKPQPKAEPVQQTPVAVAAPVVLSDEERERKRATLVSLIDQRIHETRQTEDEDVKKLISSVAAASAGSAVEMALGSKGQALMAEAKKVADEALERAIAAIEQARPVEIRLRINDAEPVKLTGRTHSCFRRVLLFAKAGQNIALIGPTGSGKTHLARQVAEALEYDTETQFAVQPCSGGMGESKLIGGLLPTGEAGRFEPFWTDFLRIFRDGGVFLADEFDSADENVALVLNSATANGYIDVQGLGRIYRADPKKGRGKVPFVMMIAMNTYGTGANRMYTGRNQLDAATLDRFIMGQVEMDYDRDLERELCASQPQWLERCWKVRDAINEKQVRRNVSTRFVLDGQRMLDMAPDEWSIEQGLRQLVMGWSVDEKQKVGLDRL